MSAAGIAKVTSSLKTIRVEDTSQLLQNIGQGQLVVGGKTWDAHLYCNEESIANPKLIEFYQLNEQSELVVLCTGEENVVSVFPPDGEPKVRRVKPKKTTTRISDEILRNSVIRLTRPD